MFTICAVILAIVYVPSLLIAYNFGRLKELKEIEK